MFISRCIISARLFFTYSWKTFPNINKPRTPETRLIFSPFLLLAGAIFSLDRRSRIALVKDRHSTPCHYESQWPWDRSLWPAEDPPTRTPARSAYKNACTNAVPRALRRRELFLSFCGRPGILCNTRDFMASASGPLPFLGGQYMEGRNETGASVSQGIVESLCKSGSTFSSTCAFLFVFLSFPLPVYLITNLLLNNS